MSSALQDPAAPPDDDALAATLGVALPAWERIVVHTLTTVPRATLTWKYYQGGYGWQARLGGKARVALWLVPREGSFLASLAVKEAILPALSASDLPPALVREIAEGRRLPEGRAARVEVRGEAEVALVLRLVDLTA